MKYEALHEIDLKISNLPLLSCLLATCHKPNSSQSTITYLIIDSVSVHLSLLCDILPHQRFRQNSLVNHIS